LNKFIWQLLNTKNIIGFFLTNINIWKVLSCFWRFLHHLCIILIMIMCQFLINIIFDIFKIVTFCERYLKKKIKIVNVELNNTVKSSVIPIVKFEQQGNKKNKIQYCNFLDIKSVCIIGMILFIQKYHIDSNKNGHCLLSIVV
jgi:hypothetical protein